MDKKNPAHLLLLLWDLIQYEYLTGDRIVCKTPGYLIAVKMTGTAAATSTVTIHDGESANEQKIVDLSALVKGSDEFNPPLPVPFRRGLFAYFGATATACTVVFVTTRE